MRWWSKRRLGWMGALWCVGALFAAGPVDFGMQQLDAAIAARNFRYKPRIMAELDIQAPETFRIEPYAAGGGHITGGDLRGLMYGLLEAAEQMRTSGRLKLTHATPALSLRGVRIAAKPEAAWFSSTEFWTAFFAGMARDRFNRLELAFETAPTDDALPALENIGRAAQEYGVDLAIGFGAPKLPALETVLANCPIVRAIALRGDSLPDSPELLRTLHDSGRRVVLELAESPRTAALIEAAGRAGAPVRLFAPLAENGSGPRPLESYVELDASQGLDALNAVSGAGFEIVAPLDEGGRPSLDAIAAWGRDGYARPGR